MNENFKQLPVICEFCDDKIKELNLFHPILEIVYECGHTIWVNVKNEDIVDKIECPAKKIN